MMASLGHSQAQSDTLMEDANPAILEDDLCTGNGARPADTSEPSSQDDNNVVAHSAKKLTQIDEDGALRDLEEGFNDKGAACSVLKLKSKQRAGVQQDGSRWKSLLGKRK